MQHRRATTSAGNPRVPTLDAASLASMDALGTRSRCDLLASFITIFLEDSPNVVRELHGGVASGDSKTVRMMAHRLKGSCGNFGARGLMAACAELEDLGSANVIDGTAEVFERVEDEYAQVRRALEQVLAGRNRTRD